jgi:hypothetical protein
MPPQVQRTGFIYPGYPGVGDYEIGDRIAVNYDTDCWVCTTAGTYTRAALISTAPATYSNGTAVFTRQVSAGWSTALPHPVGINTGIDGKYLIWLYDSEYDPSQFANGYSFGYSWWAVSVDRETFLPRTGVVSGLTYGEASGLRAGTRLFRRKSSANNLVLNEQRITLPPSRVTTSTFTGTAGRVKLPGITATTAFAYSGTGVVVEAPSVPAGATFTRNSYGIAYTKYPQATPAPEPNRTISVPVSTIAVRDLYVTTYNYGGNTAKPDPDRKVDGMNCTLQWVPHTYRDGAAPANSEVGSFRWKGTDNASACPWTSGYIYLFNSLTGARTLKVFLLTDSPYLGDITNKEVWVEVFYNNSATGGYVLATSENTNWGIPGVVGTPLTASAATWTETITGPIQSLEVSFSLTIGRAGLIAVRLVNRSNKLGHFSVYVDPYITVT